MIDSALFWRSIFQDPIRKGYLAMQIRNMMAFSYLVAFSALFWLFTASSLCFGAQDGWIAKASFPSARFGCSGVAVDGKIYVIGGASGVFSSAVHDVVMYDPIANAWERKKDIPTSRFSPASVVLEGKIYVIGGATSPSGGALSKVEVYDPASDTWEKRADMPTRRFDLCAAAVGGKIYAIGGTTKFDLSGNPPLSTVEVYDPVSDSWSKGTDLPAPRYGAFAGAADGKIYVIGGAGEHFVALSTVEEYDPLLDSWTQKAEMPKARYDLSGCIADGKMYLIGGISGQFGAPSLPTVEIYDPIADTWQEGADLLTARSSSCSAAAGGEVYAIAGEIRPLPSFACTNKVEACVARSGSEVITRSGSRARLATTWGTVKRH